MASVPFVIPSGFEPETHSLEGCCSIQLSYGTILNGSAKLVFFSQIYNYAFFAIFHPIRATRKDIRGERMLKKQKGA